MALLGGKTLLGSGVLYTDRRDFYIKPNEVAELYPSVTPFYTFVSKLKTRGSGKDPLFKLFEHRGSWVDMEFYIRTAKDWNTGSYSNAAGSITVYMTTGGTEAVPFLQKGDIVEVRAASTSLRSLGSEASATTTVEKDAVIARLLVTVVQTSTTAGATLVTFANLSLTGNDTYNLVDGDPARVVTHADAEGSDGWNDELETAFGQCQIIKTPYKLTGTLANAKLRGYDDERARIRDDKLKEHKVKLNGMFLRGYMSGASTSSRSTAPTNITEPTSTEEAYGNEIRTSWGIIPLIETYGTANLQKFSRQWASYDVDAFITDMEARSKYFNQDMEEFGFAGSKVLAELSKSGPNSFLARSGGSLALGSWQMTKLGFQVRTLTHPFGVTHIAWDPSLRGAPYNNMLAIVSPDDVERVVYRNTVLQTAIQDNDVDGIKDQYFSDEGLGCTLIERHALWKFN